MLSGSSTRRPVFEIALLSSNNTTNNNTNAAGSNSTGVLTVRYFGVLIMPLHINADGNLITALLQMSSRLMQHQIDQFDENSNETQNNQSNNQNSHKYYNNFSTHSSLTKTKLNEILIGQHSKQKQKVYFEEVEIHPVRSKFEIMKM